MKFKNQVAIVTGGRRGIGLCIGKILAVNGARVVLVGRNPAIKDVAKGLLDQGLRATGCVADVSDYKSVQSLIETTQREFGRIDILVNNAAITGIGRIEEVSLDDWNSVIKNNLTSAFLCSKFVFPVMKKQMSGKIVNISSIAGRSYSLISGIHYTSSKAALIGFTRQLAAEGARFGIRVNCIAPSPTDTEMLSSGLAQVGITASDVAKRSPLGMLAQPEQIASVCSFLCSDESSYMTGAILDVNGGAL